MSKKALKRIQKSFKKVIIDSHSRLGNETIVIPKENLREVMLFLKSDEKLKFNFLADLTAVDYDTRVPRFEVVYNLYSMELKHRVRVRVPVLEGEEVVDSVSDIWRAANWAEREVWDMFGIRFEGHPDLRRILLYEEFEGFPLRKDYPIQQSQPRMDLRAKERDAVEEHRHFFIEKNRPV